MLTCDDYLTPATLGDAFDAMEKHRGALATCTFPF